MRVEARYESIVRRCAGRFAESCGADWEPLYRQAIDAIHWQTLSPSGTPLGGVCVIDESTKGGRLFAHKVEDAVGSVRQSREKQEAKQAEKRKISGGTP